jgi:pilus assembly protein CpaB
LTAGLVIAMLAALVGYLAISRATARQAAPAGGAPDVPVVVAAQAVKVRSPLTESDVVIRRVPVNAVPEGALRDVRSAAGKVTMTDLYPGETILQQRLADPNSKSGDGHMALMVAANEVLMAFPASDLMSKVGMLKPGDHVDMLFSMKVPTNRSLGVAGAGANDDELATFNALPNVVLSAIVAGNAPASGSGGQPSPQAILLAISPQDALVLKFVKDAGGSLDMVLRAPGAEQPVATEPVDMDFVIRRYRIPTEDYLIQQPSVTTKAGE